MRARWIIRGGLLLLGGAATNIVVAWLSAAFAPLGEPTTFAWLASPERPAADGYGPVRIDEYRSLGGVRRIAWINHADVQSTRLARAVSNALGLEPPPAPNTPIEPPDATWGLAGPYAAAAVQGYVDLPRDFDPLRRPRAAFWTLPVEGRPLDDARGWPLPSLWCGVCFDDAAMTRTEFGAIALRDRAVATPPDTPHAWRALPYRVIPFAFAIDSGVHAATLAAAAFAWRRVRQGLRRRRGRCPDCGYDLRGQATAVCPECGAGRADAGPDVL